jgi:phenylalanyl-tRNA synthetase beta chain
VTLANPLTPEMAVLRTTAVPALLDTLSRNLRHRDRDVALFELGKVYLPREGDLPEERRVLTAVTGQYVSGQNWGSKQEMDFYALKAVAQTLMGRLGVTGASYRALSHPTFHPGRTAAILAGRPEAAAAAVPHPALRTPNSALPLGIIGELHPTVCAAFDIKERAYVLALDLEWVSAACGQSLPYQPLPKYPPVVQDLAVVVGDAVPAATVEEAIRHGGGKLLRSLAFFDRYQGDPIPAGKVSLAYTLTFQADDRTLTDDEVATVHKKIVGRLAAEAGGQVRGAG